MLTIWFRAITERNRAGNTGVDIMWKESREVDLHHAQINKKDGNP